MTQISEQLVTTRPILELDLCAFLTDIKWVNYVVIGALLLWAMRVMYDRAIQKQLGRQILEFCGIKLTKYSHFAPVEYADEAKIAKWLEDARQLGRQAA